MNLNENIGSANRLRNSGQMKCNVGHEKRNDRPDISEGLAGLHQQSTLNSRKGLRGNDPKPAGKWIERFEEWLADGGFLKKT